MPKGFITAPDAGSRNRFRQVRLFLLNLGERYGRRVFRRRHGYWPIPVAWVLLCLMSPSCWRTSPAETLSEAQIKAAYVYNFAKFVEWPAEVLAPAADIVLCVVGNNALDGALQALEGRKAGERELRVVQRSYPDLQSNTCHLLFIAGSEQQRFVMILKALGNAPVLTMSDAGDFAEKGGGIALLFRENKVVFEVNLESTRNAGLRLPGQLLNIAAFVYGR